VAWSRGWPGIPAYRNLVLRERLSTSLEEICGAEATQYLDLNNSLQTKHRRVMAGDCQLTSLSCDCSCRSIA
jgi:hypothetical protein